MIEDLYYPQSPYLFNIIEPNLLGKIYEIFLTEQLVLLENNTIGLGKKKDCQTDLLLQHQQKSLSTWSIKRFPKCVKERLPLRF